MTKTVGMLIAVASVLLGTLAPAGAADEESYGANLVSAHPDRRVDPNPGSVILTFTYSCPSGMTAGFNVTLTQRGVTGEQLYFAPCIGEPTSASFYVFAPGSQEIPDEPFRRGPATLSGEAYVYDCRSSTCLFWGYLNTWQQTRIHIGRGYYP